MTPKRSSPPWQTAHNVTSPVSANLMLGKLRAYNTQTVGAGQSPNYAAVMDFDQALRNKLVHDGGMADADRLNGWSALTPTQQGIWENAAG